MRGVGAVQFVDTPGAPVPWACLDWYRRLARSCSPDQPKLDLPPPDPTFPLRVCTGVRTRSRPPPPFLPRLTETPSSVRILKPIESKGSIGRGLATHIVQHYRRTSPGLGSCYYSTESKGSIGPTVCSPRYLAEPMLALRPSLRVTSSLQCQRYAIRVRAKF